MIDGTATQAPAGTADPAGDASWMLVDLLASIVGRDGAEVSRHLAAMSSRGSTEGQVEIVAGLCQCRHPQLLAALELMAEHHPDPAVAREARKSALRARTRAVAVR